MGCGKSGLGNFLNPICGCKRWLGSVTKYTTTFVQPDGWQEEEDA